MFTKQFASLYILLGVLMIGVSTFTAAAQHEATQTYDVSAIDEAAEDLIHTVQQGLERQDDAVNAWIAEVAEEVRLVDQHIQEWDAHIHNVINPGPTGPTGPTSPIRQRR